MDNSKSNRSWRIGFASVKLTMDFQSMEDAMKYKEANRGKGWLFHKPYLIDSDGGYTVSMTVQRPFKNYNPGW